MSNLEGLNYLSPVTLSPENGPATGDRTDFSLSYPISGSALQAQLEAWTSVAFDFEGEPTIPLPSADDTSKDSVSSDLAAHYHHRSAQPQLDKQKEWEAFVLSHGLTYPPTLGMPTQDVTAHNLAINGQVPTEVKPTIPASGRSRSGTKTGTSVKRSQSSSHGSESGSPAMKPLGDDEINALALEEDKRRRNTAASARFRIKKKQREAALESTAKELREKVADLEKEVESLRTENGWLRGLIVQKAQRAETENDSKDRLDFVAGTKANGESGPEREGVAI